MKEIYCLERKAS